MIDLVREKKVLLIGWLRYLIATFFFVVIGLLFLANYTMPVVDEVTFEIEQGATLSQIANDLKDNGLIYSRSYFSAYVIYKGHAESMKSGVYLFKKGEAVPKMVERFINHDTQQKVYSVTLPEGFTREEMSIILSDNFDNFDITTFLKDTEEGYLFPDTYSFFATATTKEIIKTLKERRKDIIKEIVSEKKLPKDLTEEDWIIIASIVEREANTADSRRRVADIILRRLAEGMPLQVDATFVYGVNKNSFTLTTEDLLDDHDYNTYTRKGLPPTPISNPGRDALESVLDPIPNTSVYFLTGLDGEMYYADTYDGHLKNRRLYLNK